MRPETTRMITEIEQNRTERLRKMELRIEKAESRHALTEAAAEEVEKEHKRVIAKEESLFQSRVQQIRQEGHAVVLAAEARAEDAQKKREEIETQIKDIVVEMQEILELETFQREDLSNHLQKADIRTARAVLDAEVHVQSLRHEAEITTRKTFQDLQGNSRCAWALQEQVGGLKEAVTGVTACQRDHQLQHIPKVAPRPFDLEETPFDGLGKFGSFRSTQVPKGFYAETLCARTANAAPRLIQAQSVER
mmetsp:Transcript_21885/g.45555  ORF Transcript_21885/g.45555 Transcript_21885/m.45555 type:complete len:250 (-) Transcript_21885:15-764(-)